MDWIGLILVVGSVVISGLYGYTVIDAVRTIRAIGKEQRFKEGKALKIGHVRVGVGLALDALFWPAAIVFLSEPDPETEAVRGVVFIVAWVVGSIIRLVFWMRIQ